MKKSELIRKLHELDWHLKREGGNHEIWTNGIEIQPVPRHREISEKLAKSIIKRAKESNHEG